MFFNNLIYRQLPNGENQYYQYDLENQLVRAEIKKPAGNTEIWTYAYDPTDNLIQETGWDGKITAYGYDVAGQLVQQTEYGQSNNEGRLKDRPETWHIHHFKRNILGQLIEKQSCKVSHKNGQSKDEGISRTRFEYDPITGNLTKARNQHSSVELAYDELDRLIGETTVHNGQSATVGYQYDPLGNRIRTILPDGRHIDYLYYGSGHLHQISLDGEVVSDIERDKLHREIQRTQGSISSLYDYDPMGRLKSQRTVRSGTQTLHGKQNPLAGGAVNRRYAYDKAGNLIQSADQRSGVLHYVYDKIGRIQEARNSQTGRSETFAFDPAHNILSDKIAEGKGKGSNISSGNRLESYNGIEYTYDALGNLIYRQLPDGENQYYQYDLENQLVRAEIKKPVGNTEIWTYAYDPFGRRLSKERQDKLAWTSTDPKRTHFVWDGSRLLQEYTYKGSYTYLYTDQDSYEPLAQVFDNAKDGKQYLAYFHTDQIGIPKEMTDVHGNLLWYGEYTAWGRLKKDERVYRNAHQPFRLQNQYFDEETGLHYNLMRYYEPEAGRFVNQDPIGLLGGENFYQFGPNITVWIDPLGLEKCESYCDKLLKKFNVIFGKHKEMANIASGTRKDSHHIYQDSAMKGLAGYDRGDAIAVVMRARNTDRTTRGTPHYKTQQVQRTYPSGGRLKNETMVAYRALRAAGYAPHVAGCLVLKAKEYLFGIGANDNSRTSIPRSRVKHIRG